MARIEKTVFIGYRRKDISWALAVYQYLTASEYDVFFDYTSLSVGDFEKVIVGNIRARAHFVLLLTPATLDKCNEPGDLLRREIETAIDEKRNIIPLFFDGFSFGSASVAERLTGKLEVLNRYNGLDVPAGYFPEAMERLRNRYLNIPLKAVLHPIPAEVREKVKVEQAAANEALEQQKEIIRELLEHHNDRQSVKGAHESKGQAKWGFLFGGVIGLILSFVVGLFGYQNLSANSPNDGSPIAFVTDNPERTFASALPNITITTEHAATTIPLTSTPQYAIGSTRTSSRDGMILQYVPAGSFMMGANANDALAKCEEIWGACDRDWFLDVDPAHLVHLDAYWIDKTEVTTGKYQLCVEAGGCKEPGNKSSYTHDNYFGEREFEDYPMIQVDWNMANAYCEWVGRRLPTEAEWEKAARGESTWIFPWGDMFDGSLLNYCDENCPLDWADRSFDDGYEDVSPVGYYPDDKSVYGAQDMAGNVLEWVADWYDAYPGNTNENRNFGTIFRVFRGGSWANNQIAAQLISRGYHAIARPSSNIGFRCAMDASE